MTRKRPAQCPECGCSTLTCRTSADLIWVCRSCRTEWVMLLSRPCATDPAISPAGRDRKVEIRHGMPFPEGKLL